MGKFERYADAGKSVPWSCSRETLLRFSHPAANSPRRIRGKIRGYNSLGIDNADALRKLLRRFVMIEDDDIHALPLQPGNLSDGAGAAVNRNQQVWLAFPQTSRDTAGTETVAFGHTMRQEVLHGRSRRVKYAP